VSQLLVSVAPADDQARLRGPRSRFPIGAQMRPLADSSA
jgi:hypothetical protein